MRRLLKLRLIQSVTPLLVIFIIAMPKIGSASSAHKKKASPSPSQNKAATVAVSTPKTAVKADSPTSTPDWITQLSDIHVLKVFMTPTTTGYQDEIDYISAPTSTLIEISMYHLTDPNIKQALINRANQGNVTINIILDSGNMRDDNTLQIAKDLQGTPNINVKASNMAFTITHTKYMRINGAITFITTINWTSNTTAQRDYGMITDDPQVATEVGQVFAMDWSNGNTDLDAVSQQEKNKDPNAPLVPPDPSNTPPVSMPNLLWSPVNSNQKVIDLFNYAAPNTTLYFEVENLREPDIQDAIVDAINTRNVNVIGIVPQVDLSSANYNFQAINDIQGRLNPGKTLPIRMMPPPSTTQTPYMHAKVIIVTGVDGTTLAVVMSENDTVNSLQYARELGVVFKNPDSIATIKAAIMQDQAVSVPPPQQNDPNNFGPGKKTMAGCEKLGAI